MKYLKTLGLAVVAAMALMAFAGAGSASATILTCTEGTSKVQCPTGTEIDASVEGGTIKLTAGELTITCKEGTVKGSIENAGSSTETVSGLTSEVTFKECPNCSVVEVTNGTLEVHTQNNGTTANGNGTLTGKNFTAHLVCFGFTCNYETTATPIHLGTITGSSNLENKTATIDVEATLVKDTGSSFVCNNTATWEGSYTVTKPDWLDVD